MYVHNTKCFALFLSNKNLFRNKTNQSQHLVSPFETDHFCSDDDNKFFDLFCFYKLHFGPYGLCIESGTWWLPSSKDASEAQGSTALKRRGESNLIYRIIKVMKTSKIIKSNFSPTTNIAHYPCP